MSRPKVSIVAISYNQESYVLEALESFLAQKTDFEFEVIIGDDASTDGTQKIISQFVKKHPKIVRPILRKRNVGVHENLFDVLRQAKGEYIALCEGDDYWTDPTKLQRQADFLDSHPDYALCFHPVKVFFQKGEEPDTIFPEDKEGFTTERLLEVNYIQTNSVMYRKQTYDDLPIDILPLDWYLHLYHAQFGKIGFIDRVMASYRRHEGGIWWNTYKQPSLFWEKYGSAYLTFLRNIMTMYGRQPEYRDIILNKHIAGSYEAMAQLKQDDINEVAAESIRDTPNETWDYIKSLIGQVKYHSAKSIELSQLLEQEQIISKEKDHEIQRLADNLDAITSSKSWQLITTYRRVNGRIKNTLKRNS